MDQETTNIVALVSAFGGVLLGVVGYINHHRLRSSCCGKKLEVSLDIEATTPPHPKPLP